MYRVGAGRTNGAVQVKKYTDEAKATTTARPINFSALFTGSVAISQGEVLRVVTTTAAVAPPPAAAGAAAGAPAASASSMAPAPADALAASASVNAAVS